MLARKRVLVASTSALVKARARNAFAALTRQIATMAFRTGTNG